MFIIRHKKIFIAASAILVAASLISLFVFGVRVGIDFKGGALSEIVYNDARPEAEAVRSKLAGLGLGSVSVQPTGEKGYILKSRDLTEEEHQKLLGALAKTGAFEETSFNSIGPSVGRELTKKAVIAVVLVALAIICFIAFAFRRVSGPSNTGRHGVASWKYGVIAIVALLHDITIPAGIFVYLSRYLGAEIDTLFVVALLTILGLSVSDTIVIFYRIKENLKKEASAKRTFPEVVGESLNQSFARSVSTSLTVILVLLALFFFGPETTKYFALMLVTGMFFGTYSSLFLASPLLVTLEEWQRKRKQA